MVCDWLEFSWSYEQDSRVIPGGGAHLFDFATVFDSWLDSLWLSEETMSAEQVDFMWTLRGFDRTFHAHRSAHLRPPKDSQSARWLSCALRKSIRHMIFSCMTRKPEHRDCWMCRFGSILTACSPRAAPTDGRNCCWKTPKVKRIN